MTGVPVSASSEPAWAEKTSGISSCEGGRFSRTAITTTTGSSAATAPLTLISAVSSATSRPVSTSSRVRLSSPAPAISSCPAQAVTPVRSSARADDEQRGDEDHGRIAEPGQGLGQRQDAGGPQGDRDAHRDDDDRDPVPDEQDDRRGDDQAGQGDRAHASFLPLPDAAGVVALRATLPQPER